MRRWLTLALIVVAVTRSAVITFAAGASFTFDQQTASNEDAVRRWNQSAATARTSERASQEGVAAQQDAPPPPIEPSVIVEFVPLRLASTEASAGPSKDRAAGVWSVYLCNQTASRVIVQRARVYMASPHILPIPDGQAAALLNSRVEKNGWSIFGRGYKKFGPLVATGVGAAFGGPVYAAIAGLSLQALNGLGATAAELAPLYKLYAPLPAQIVLEPGGCAEHDMLSGLVPKAHRHKGVVQ